MITKRALSGWLFFAILIGGALPVLFYWQWFETVPSIDTDEAKMWLSKTNAPLRLVDVRAPKAFAAGHLPNAISLPLEKLGSPEITNQLPSRAQSILVICNSGLSSAMATRELRAMGYRNAFNIAGGLSAWNTLAGGKCIALNARQMSAPEQWLAAITAFGIKPFYMLLVLIWVAWLWRRTEPDLVALRWGLIIFWLGENACSANYLFFNGLSDLWEFFHNYGMAVGFGFMAWAVLEGFDHRLLKLSPPKERCAALNLCKTCIKYAAVPCKLQQVFKMLIPAAMVAAALPLFAQIKVVSYNAGVLGSVENFSLMASSQMFENRYCAGLALLLLAASWLVMVLKKSDPVPLAKILFAAAMGFLSFGLMRLFLSGAYTENLLWYVVWEEWTELVFIIAIGFVLWVFRDTLLAKPGPAGEGQSSPSPA